MMWPPKVTRGLSPRVRGNPEKRLELEKLLRSIPARAGEPRCTHRSLWDTAVYPRACGGTEHSHCVVTHSAGLSPRVRGNLPRNAYHRSRVGSIPARAGEPSSERLPPVTCRVYPRACGGTHACSAERNDTAGLSPRVRGNHQGRKEQGSSMRSIPARAGEPWRPGLPALPRGVYPRACGGTARVPRYRKTANGLSPRVRGNRLLPRGQERKNGSIPARAGEPPVDRGSGLKLEVYPRACGGTLHPTTLHVPAGGLSPRVRGNPGATPCRQRWGGSIPARAGEPLPFFIVVSVVQVYPRACGGTCTVTLGVSLILGLSPRVRGNQVPKDRFAIRHGSIPARAGEPLAQSLGVSPARVYPVARQVRFPRCGQIRQWG